MKAEIEKKLLQASVLLGCMVPLGAGLAGALQGTIFMHGVIVPSLDSHFRYLSGLLLGIGFGFASTVRNIERQSARFQLLTFIVFIGGLARLAGIVLTAICTASVLFALAMELAVTPLLCAWQWRLTKRFNAQ